MEIDVNLRTYNRYGFVRWPAIRDREIREIFANDKLDENGKYICNLFGENDSITVNFDRRRIFIGIPRLMEEYGTEEGIFSIEKNNEGDIIISSQRENSESIQSHIIDEELQQTDGTNSKLREIIQQLQEDNSLLRDLNQNLEFQIQIYRQPLNEVRELHSNYTQRDFLKLVKALLENMGYINVQITDRTGDRNVDIIAEEVDPFGIENKIIIQVKQYAEGNNVRPNDIREFAGSIINHNAKAGIFITTSDYSRQAIQEKQESRISNRIKLINGEDLLDYLRTHFWFRE